MLFGREEGRRAAGDERGGNADDDDDGVGSRDVDAGEGDEEDEEEVMDPQPLLAPHTGRLASLLPSILYKELKW